MNPIIEKIKKLLRLGKDSKATPNEAAVAMAKAIKLAAENGIDLSSIPTDDSGTGGMSHVTESSQQGPAHRLAAWLVKRHFSVATLFDSSGKKPVIHFIGIDTNCQLASYCYTYLVRSSRTAWRKRENRRLRDRDSFLKGYFAAIDSMMPEVFHRDGLILSTDNYVQTVIFAGRTGIIFKPMASAWKGGLSDSAFRHGVRSGNRDGIRNAIRGTDKPLLPH